MSNPQEPGEATAQPPDGEGAAQPAPKPRRADPAREATTGGLREYAEGIQARKRPKAAPVPPAGSDGLEKAVLQAQKELAEGATTPPFSRDPYRLVLAGLSVSLGIFPTLVRRIESSVSTVVVELGKLVDAVRHPLTDAERAALKRDIIEASREAAKASAGDLAKVARAMNARSLAIAFSGAVVAVAVAGVGAFYAGRSSSRAEVAAQVAAQKLEIELAQQRIAVTPAQARVWLRLILANPDIEAAERQAINRTTDATGRPAGAVPMWLQPAGLPVAARR